MVKKLRQVSPHSFLGSIQDLFTVGVPIRALRRARERNRYLLCAALRGINLDKITLYRS